MPTVAPPRRAAFSPISARLRASLALLTEAETTLLHANRWFAQCGSALQQRLIDSGRRLRLAEGQALFERGGVPQGLSCVLGGALRVGTLGREGEQSLLAYLEPGQWFGEISLLDGLPRTHDAVADAPTEVWVVAQAPLQDWLDAHPAHWRDIARLACAKLRMSFEVLEDIAQLPLDARLAKRLVLVARGYLGNEPVRSHVRLPQEQLALMLGVSRQTVNKLLKAMAGEGLIALRYGEIELLDLAALQRLGRL